NYHDELRGNTNGQYTETMIYDNSSVGYSSIKSYFDGFGREYKRTTGAGTYNNTPILQEQDTAYDAYGRIISKSIPYIQGQQALSTTYTYDSFNRVISETVPNSATT